MFTPSNLSWVVQENCSCPEQTYCIRPSIYTKPIICLHKTIGINNFINYLKSSINTTITTPLTTTTRISTTINENTTTQNEHHYYIIYILLFIILMFHTVYWGKKILNKVKHHRKNASATPTTISYQQVQHLQSVPF
ncbi:hypothetical protein Mgra_00007571 [Meloidogyne graminicola]|uniref:Uncharacterized protein n=1 Tax=Meloidogyne graminicola TaxID=189291 RepID=A0A8S9ZI35_9BILA|nr:hypothetical protein Mgra_00007571 [Meloidogyne graminicola]